MTNLSEICIGWLLFMLIVAGLILIILGIYRIYNYKGKSKESLTSLETKIFKISGPTSLIFGMIFLGGVTWYLRTQSLEEYKQEITSLKTELEDLKQGIHSPENSHTQNFFVNIDRFKPVPILEGRVLIIYEPSFRSRRLIFRGIFGLSKNRQGQFVDNEIEFKEGDQFFIRVDSLSTFGVNVIGTNEHGILCLQFFKLL